MTTSGSLNSYEGCKARAYNYAPSKLRQHTASVLYSLCLLPVSQQGKAMLHFRCRSSTCKEALAWSSRTAPSLTQVHMDHYALARFRIIATSDLRLNVDVCLRRRPFAAKGTGPSCSLLSVQLQCFLMLSKRLDLKHVRRMGKCSMHRHGQWQHAFTARP